MANVSRDEKPILDLTNNRAPADSVEGDVLTVQADGSYGLQQPTGAAVGAGGYAFLPLLITPSAISNGSITDEAFNVRVFKFFLPYAIEFDNLALIIQPEDTLPVSCALAIYDDAGALVWESGSLTAQSESLSVPQNFQFVLPSTLSLPFGVYYFAQTASQDWIDQNNAIYGFGIETRVGSMMRSVVALEVQGLAENVATGNDLNIVFPVALGTITIGGQAKPALAFFF
jgi:hypothetical protein